MRLNSNKMSPNKEKARVDTFTNFSKTFKDGFTPMLLKWSHQKEREQALPNSFCEAGIAPVPKPDTDRRNV